MRKTREPDPQTLRRCGAIGVAGALFAVIADIVSWFLADFYNAISQTISSLAVGRASWLIDLGIWAFALSCVGVGTGMFALREPTKSWKIGCIAITVAGAAAAVISFMNEYAGQSNAGANVHTWAVLVLYIGFAVAALAAAPGLRDLREETGRYSLLSGYAWIVLAPTYYLWFPKGWAGAFERALVALVIVWLVRVAHLLRAERREMAEPIR